MTPPRALRSRPVGTGRSVSVGNRSIPGWTLIRRSPKPSEPIVPHLDQLLGPARSVQDELDSLGRQNRAQDKPAVWFLPLNEPISPHLDELLGKAFESGLVIWGTRRFAFLPNPRPGRIRPGGTRHADHCAIRERRRRDPIPRQP